jgi:uncharacterized SAM-binding protein YcdF (DUF218 family)
MKGAEVIVVLSSSILPPSLPRTTALAGSDTYERCFYAAWLHLHRSPLPILASGGGLGETPYAVIMKAVLQREGVAPELIWMEDRSRSTYESALYAAPMLRQKGIRKIVLVTEAYHMRRAAACFRKQGLEVIPAPCEFRGSFGGSFLEFIPDWKAALWNEDILHELVGLLWYRVQGRV